MQSYDALVLRDGWGAVINEASGMQVDEIVGELFHWMASIVVKFFFFLEKNDESSPNS
jgi:hypothetical protein